VPSSCATRSTTASSTPDALATFLLAYASPHGHTAKIAARLATVLLEAGHDVMQRGLHPTDVRRDFDYTDWDAVDAFARACAELPMRAHA
jgi:menaquinone-dependent protoporphyrinogen IX oxidase